MLSYMRDQLLNMFSSEPEIETRNLCRQIVNAAYEDIKEQRKEEREKGYSGSNIDAKEGNSFFGSKSNQFVPTSYTRTVALESILNEYTQNKYPKNEDQTKAKELVNDLLSKITGKNQDNSQDNYQELKANLDYKRAFGTGKTYGDAFKACVGSVGRVAHKVGQAGLVVLSVAVTLAPIALEILAFDQATRGNYGNAAVYSAAAGDRTGTVIYGVQGMQNGSMSNQQMNNAMFLTMMGNNNNRTSYIPSTTYSHSAKPNEKVNGDLDQAKLKIKEAVDINSPDIQVANLKRTARGDFSR